MYLDPQEARKLVPLLWSMEATVRQGAAEFVAEMVKAGAAAGFSQTQSQSQSQSQSTPGGRKKGTVLTYPIAYYCLLMLSVTAAAAAATSTAAAGPEGVLRELFNLAADRYSSPLSPTAAFGLLELADKIEELYVCAVCCCVFVCTEVLDAPSLFMLTLH